MFRKVLVANRGEIACRVLGTLRSLGIPSVAVHHFVDRGAPHVALADESIELVAPANGAPAAAYLDGAGILEACRQSGADALHPGYGFLSENADFAEATAAAGVRFIGPSAGVMRLMGDKIRSRELAARAGVPTSPSVTLDASGASVTLDASGASGAPEASALERAAALGFPLLVKASAGGGGKGMKIVRNASELASNIALARSEAARYFGDGRVYAERLLERPRHIEVQVLGDGRGNVIHLGERECSIQRRYQKIIEESPAANLQPTLRSQIIEAALAVARAARYENAGTVEFIVGSDSSFYFLEMNTRLQVEHPVTELVTNLDLVEAQLRIAAENALPFGQDAVRFTGHAIECRVCAEEPEREFRPAVGKVGLYRLPHGEGVRVDSGIREGQTITASFDSLLLKLIVHGETREQAATRMHAALFDLVLLGVPTNIDYLARIVASDAFRAGHLHTGFIEEHAPALARRALSVETRAAALAAGALGDDTFHRVAFDVPEPWASIGAYRS